MAEVRWTPQAADDLSAIAEFIAQGSPHYATIFVMDTHRSGTDRAQRKAQSGRETRNGSRAKRAKR